MTVDAPPAPLHPADQIESDRLARSLGRRAPDGIFRCDHGLYVNACRTCIELRHAEAGSITVRAAYAFGDWPPAPARP